MEEAYRSTGPYEVYILGRIPRQEIAPRRILVGLSPHAQTDADPSHAGVRRGYMAAAAAPPVLSGLPSTGTKQLRAAGTVDDLDAIVQRAKLLMMLEQTSEKAASVDKVDLDSTIGQLQQQIAALTDQVAALSSKRNPAISSESGARRCFRCHQLGHVQRNCPQAPRCFTCGRPGHYAKNCQAGNGRGMPRMGPRHPQN